MLKNISIKNKKTIHQFSSQVYLRKYLQISNLETWILDSFQYFNYTNPIVFSTLLVLNPNALEPFVLSHIDILFAYYQNVTQDLYTKKIVRSLGYNFLTFDFFGVTVRRNDNRNIYDRHDNRVDDNFVDVGVSEYFIYNIMFLWGFIALVCF